MKSQHVTQLSFWISIMSFAFIAGCSSEENGPGGVGVVPIGVSAIIPANNATLVPRNTAIEISFSEAMDPNSINYNTIIILDGTTYIPGAVTYSGTKAVFTPGKDLMALTAYTVTVTTGATTLAGKPFLRNSISSFTTGGSVSVLGMVPLGFAFNYAIVAKTAINNSSTSSITGNLGLCPAATSFITGLALTNASGYATSSQVIGKVYGADMVSPTFTNLTSTVTNMATAYNDAAGRRFPDFVELNAGYIGGKTLTPGLYKWTGNVSIPSSMVISGDENDVWIFQIDGNLTTSSAINITLEGGVLAKKIFWQVAGEVTLGSYSHFEGIILSKTGITLQTGASLNGKMLAQTAVVLDSNVVTMK